MDTYNLRKDINAEKKEIDTINEKLSEQSELTSGLGSSKDSVS